jgi:3-deoxy-D-manno-octulosonic-acid transferase
MRFLYDIAIRIYWLTAWLISPWNRKAKQWIRGRKGWYRSLQKACQAEDHTVWIHCASLGEFEQGRPVIEEVRKKFPDHRILLTFFSPSGYEKRKTYEGADHVMYLPLDTRRNARRWINALSLEMVIFIKYEFWYHFLHRLQGQKIPIYLASGNFRSDQLFFKKHGSWYRKFLDCFTHIFVQQERSKQLLNGIGIQKVSVAGDTRFDRVKKVAETPYQHEKLDLFAHEAKVIVAGSTWEGDEQILAHAYHELPSEIKWIIAPHELSDAHISKLMRRFPDSVLFTSLEEKGTRDTRVIIVDTIGHLSYLYRYGTLAYIGGGFGKGIHNILEAATYHMPVLFGPLYHKFSEAVELVQLGGAFPVRDQEELLFTIRQQLEHPNLLKTASDIAGNFVLERAGATSAILEKVCIKQM